MLYLNELRLHFGAVFFVFVIRLTVEKGTNKCYNQPILFCEVFFVKKTFKAVLSVLLAVLVAAGTMLCSFTAFAEDGRIKFSVASDIHIAAKNETLNVNYPESELFFHAGGSGNLYDEGEGILKSMLKQSAASGVDFVLVPGDMTRSGTEAEHKFISNIFREFTKSTGIPVYVIPGNHDYFSKTTTEQIKEWYADCGYNRALTVDTKTASYTADLSDDYRLIAVDSNNPGVNGDGLNDELFSWIDTQVAAARADGKEIIYTMHHSVLEHLTLGSLLMKDFVVRNTDDVAERFCEWGIQYTFTGHEHGNDVAKYVGKNGNVLYDILTTSLSSYPLEYRLVDFSKDGMDIKMQSIDQCDFSTLIGGYNEKQLALMKSDYKAYSLGVFKYAIEQKVLKYVSPDFIKGKLKAEDGVLSDEVDAVMGLVTDTLKMNLYDNGDGKPSIEALAAKKGMSIPKSDYKSLIDMVSSLVALHYYGDENMPCNSSPEGEILVKGLNTGLEYIISNLGPEALTALIPIVETILPDYSDNLIFWFTAAVYDRENTYKVAEEILYPLLDQFTQDKAPADRNVTLPAVGEKVSTQEQIKAVIDKIFNVIIYILKVVLAFIKY